MKKYYWSVIKQPVYITLVITLVCSALCAGSYYLVSETRLEYNRAMGMLQGSRDQYVELVERTKIYAEYARQFTKLRNHGIIGKENRLSWLEALQSANDKLMLPLMQYKIAPQEPYPEEVLGYDYPDVYVTRTAMDLDMTLFHEGDLFTIFDNIKRQAQGMSLLDHCSIEPTQKIDMQEMDISRGILQARCRIYWIQVALSRPEPVEPGM